MVGFKIFAAIMLLSFSVSGQGLFFAKHGKYTPPPPVVPNYPVNYTGTVYYVNPYGNDGNTGLTVDKPFRTLAKASTVNPGAGGAILLLAGSTFEGTLTVNGSGTSGNPITVGAYGLSTLRPTITGSERITGWTLHSGNIWKATFNTTVNQIFVNNFRYKAARYPATGFANVDAAPSTSSLTCNALSSSVNYAGAIVHIHSSSYGLDDKTVTSSVGNTLQLSSAPFGSVNVGEKFVIMGKLEFLTAPGMWYYDSVTKTVYLWKIDGTQPSDTEVRGSTQNYGVYASGKNYITIKDIDVTQQKTDGVYVYNCDYYTIDNVTSTYADAVGIHDYLGSHGTIEDNTVTGSNHYGVEVYSDTGNNQINRNTVQNVALFDNLGLSGIGEWYSGSGIFIQNSVVSSYTPNQINYARYNVASNIGYNGVHFSNEAVIEYNFVSGYCLTKNDGGGVYTASPTTLPVGSEVNKGSIIRYNICEYGYGIATNGTAYGEGIYLDETSGSILVERNTVSYQTGRGIFSHDGNNHIIRYNTIFLCENGLYTSRDGLNISMTNNIVYGGLNQELVHNNALTGAITLNSNTYINHYTNNVFQINLGTRYNFTNWKSTTGYDALSTCDNSAIVGTERLIYNNTTAAKYYYLNGATAKDIYGNAIVLRFELQPFESKIVTGTNLNLIE